MNTEIKVSRELLEEELESNLEEWKNIVTNPMDDDYVQTMVKKANRWGRIVALRWVLENSVHYEDTKVHVTIK